MPVSALEAVTGDWSRDLGGDRSSGRLPRPVHGLSSFPSSHTGIVSDVPGRLSSGSSLAARGRGDACQRSLGNRPRSGSRLLQSPLPGGEGDWRLEACDRSLTFERLRPADVVQDGNSRFGAVVCQRGGFSSFLGSEGCILSDPDPQIIEEAVEVHVGGDSLPVQSPVLRSVDCSPGLYQGLRGGVSLGTLPRDQTAPLSGQLVPPNGTKQPEWFNKSIAEAISNRQKAYNISKLRPLPETKVAHMKECRNVDKLIRRAKLNEEDRVAAAAKDNPKAFFAHVNSRKPVKNTIGPLKDRTGSIISSDEGMANIFNE